MTNQVGFAIRAASDLNKTCVIHDLYISLVNSPRRHAPLAKFQLSATASPP